MEPLSRWARWSLWIRTRFMWEVSRDRDLKITRMAKLIEDAVLPELLRVLPFAVGMEHVNLLWLRGVWDRLRTVFNAEAAAFSGGITDYLRGKMRP